MPPLPQQPEKAEIHSWLVSRLVAYLGRPARDLDTALPFSELGLDSLAALALCGDIEDEYGVVLESTAAWDHPTVGALSRHLARRAAQF